MGSSRQSSPSPTTDEPPQHTKEKADSFLGRSPAQPRVWVSMAVNHAHHTDHGRIDLVVDAVREPFEKNPA